MGRSRRKKVQAEEEQINTKVEQLQKALAEREEELSSAINNSQLKTVEHVETLAKISSTKAALEESKIKCAALDESLKKTAAGKRGKPPEGAEGQGGTYKEGER